MPRCHLSHFFFHLKTFHFVLSSYNKASTLSNSAQKILLLPLPHLSHSFPCVPNLQLSLKNFTASFSNPPPTRSPHLHRILTCAHKRNRFLVCCLNHSATMSYLLYFGGPLKTGNGVFYPTLRPSNITRQAAGGIRS